MAGIPKVSIVIPTLNSQRTLEACLESINRQRYGGELEVIITDGGSTDKTIQIARKFKTKIVSNKLKTGEAGKAVGAREAKGDLIVFVDSDNILTCSDWIEKIVKPFIRGSGVIASEPVYFEYNRQDHWLTRYFALLGMGDPINLFLGNYDHFSNITGKWIELPIKYKTSKNYYILSLKNIFPTIGANGFMIKKACLDSYLDRDYLFDIDILKELIHDGGEIKIAKVKVGITHLFSGNINTFIRKQRRRIRDLLYYRKKGMRQLQLDKTRLFWGVLKFIFATLTIVPLLYQMVCGFIRRKDIAWVFHPLACWLTLYVYSWETIRFVFIKEEFSRDNWKQ